MYCNMVPKDNQVHNLKSTLVFIAEGTFVQNYLPWKMDMLPDQNSNLFS